MDTAKEWYAAVRNGSARATNSPPRSPRSNGPTTMGCLESYDRAYAHETAARERMNQAYERVRR